MALRVTAIALALGLLGGCSDPDPVIDVRELRINLKISEYCEALGPWAKVRSVEAGVGHEHDMREGTIQFLEAPVWLPVESIGAPQVQNAGVAVGNLAPRLPSLPADDAYRLLGAGYDADEPDLEKMTICGVSSVIGPGDEMASDEVWVYLTCASDPEQPCADDTDCDDGRVCSARVDGLCTDASDEIFGFPFPYDLCLASRVNAVVP